MQANKGHTLHYTQLAESQAITAYFQHALGYFKWKRLNDLSKF